jgi:CheY-specific phosphatase CheX
MKKTPGLPAAPSLMLRWLREAMPYLLKAPLPLRAIRRATLSGAGGGSGEIGVVCQFAGDLEGEMTLLASRRTAYSFAAAMHPGSAIAADDDISLLKASLGALLTVLMSKLLARCKDNYHELRVTTPSCIFGVDLLIEPGGEDTTAAGFATPFGRVDIVLSLRPSPGRKQP